MEAPLYLEIDGTKQRTAILTGGLPFHRRIDKRRLDTLLIVRGESRRHFRLAIGVDCRSVMADAWSALMPATVVDHNGPAQAGSGWLFHIDARHVVATHWNPKIEKVDDQPRCTGVCVRLLETLGRDGRITLQSFRPIKSARRQNFRGETTGQCEVVDGRVQLKMEGHEWTQIELDW
jgi:alpha-mannosidase